MNSVNSSFMKFLTRDERSQMDQKLNCILHKMKRQELPYAALVKKAYVFALQAHNQERRITGEPYMMHPLEVARILAETGHDSNLIAAALLHDVVAVCGISLQELEREFGTDIADTVRAVTEISKLFASDAAILDMDMDILSDAKSIEMLTEIHNRNALFIKCADRIHNLNTIHVFSKEKQKEKVYNTRSILIPVAKKMHINKMASILGNLCLKIENPEVYRKIQEAYREIIYKNQTSLTGDGGIMTTFKQIVSGDRNVGKSVKNIEFAERYEDDIFAEIAPKLHKFSDVKEACTKKNFVLYDVFFVIKNECTETPEEIFFQVFDRLHESKFRLTITGLDKFEDEILFYKLEDCYGNRFRLFLQSEKENMELIHGIHDADEGTDFSANEAQSKDLMQGVITVFKKDGTPMLLSQNATVLDFAFAIDRNIGICCKYALLNGSASRVPIYQKLRPGDMVEVVSDHIKEAPECDIPHATVRWFEYLTTRSAIKSLSRWLEKNMDSAVPKMLVYDNMGKEYEIEIASTVLDLAFYISERIGLHVKKAFINEEEVELDRTLRYGDHVRFEYDIYDRDTPVFTWLAIVKTKLAKEKLITFFEKKYCN